MRISLIGVSDPEKILRTGKITKKELDQLIKDVASLLVRKKVEVILLPSKGIPYSIAQEYKKNNGKKVIGVVPRDDKEYGIAYIKDYFDIMDEEINVGDWYDLNGLICSLANIALCIGISCGAVAEIAMLKYHYKFHNSKTKLVIFENTISKKLHEEVMVDLKDVEYINSINELERIIDNYKKE